MDKATVITPSQLFRYPNNAVAPSYKVDIFRNEFPENTVKNEEIGNKMNAKERRKQELQNERECEILKSKLPKIYNLN